MQKQTKMKKGIFVTGSIIVDEINNDGPVLVEGTKLNADNLYFVLIQTYLNKDLIFDKRNS